MTASSKQDRSKKAPRVSWTPDLRQRITEMLPTHTIPQIADATGLTYRQVDSFLYHNDLYTQKKWRGVEKPFDISPLAIPELAYLAGIVDGEGTISIAPSKVKGKVYYRPHVTISNTSMLLVDWLESRGFSGTLAKNTNGRAYWRCTVSGLKAEPLLTAILPFLVIKKEHAELCLSFMHQRMSGPKTSPISPEMIAMYHRIKTLNIRGSKLSEDTKVTS